MGADVSAVIFYRDYNASVNILLEGKRTVGTTGIAGCPGVRPTSSRQLVGSEAATSLRASASKG